MSESCSISREAVRQMKEFRVTDSGELDLGLDDATGGARPAAAPHRREAAAGAPWLPVKGRADGGRADGDWADGDWADGGWVDPDLVDPDWEPGDEGDPETDPDDHEAWLAGLPADVRADFLAGAWTGAGESIPAGFLHHVRGGPSGVGFAAGGVLDTLAPGPWLAEAIAATTADGHAQLGESELIGVMCAWRRISAWAASGEAAAVVTLAKRRAAASQEPGRSKLAEHVTDEIAAALTLTGRSADRLLTVASQLVRMPDAFAALRHGEIDWAKATVFADELAALSDDVMAAIIADRFLGRAGAGGWTTGQLRAALRRAVLAADPQAADRRRADARKDAEVRAWDEASGNSGLAGRELPPADVLAADARLTALAKWLQARGAAGTISQLRAAVYTALLNGRPVESLLAAKSSEVSAAEDRATDSAAEDRAADAAAEDRATDSAAEDRAADAAAEDRAADAAAEDRAADAAAEARAADSAPDDAGAGPDAAAGSPLPGEPASPAISGTIHLTMPLSAWLGGPEPGEVAGHGPVDASTSRELAAMLAESGATRWCLTVTGADGRAIGHSCSSRGPAADEPVIKWAAGLRAKLQLLEQATCSHAREVAGYVPPNSLGHLIRVRQRTCCYVGCRRPAVRCDLDHTVPYDKGGRTCECNISPVCRRHHRAKQAPGWHLEQRKLGEMIWQLPSGRVYETVGDPY
jgi:hypothetical protein